LKRNVPLVSIDQAPKDVELAGGIAWLRMADFYDLPDPCFGNLVEDLEVMHPDTFDTEHYMTIVTLQLTAVTGSQSRTRTTAIHRTSASAAYVLWGTARQVGYGRQVGDLHHRWSVHPAGRRTACGSRLSKSRIFLDQSGQHAPVSIGRGAG
jgi:hypothetical protein